MTDFAAIIILGLCSAVIGGTIAAKITERQIKREFERKINGPKDRLHTL